MGSVNPRLSGGGGGAAIYEVRGQAISAASEKAVIKLFAYQSVSNVLLTCCRDHYITSACLNPSKESSFLCSVSDSLSLFSRTLVISHLL